jgi:Protein of unknown function (DUF3352)
MRKLLLPLALILGTLLIAGCGDSGGSDSSSPLDEALRYLPADAPFAVAIDTDTTGEQYQAAGDALERFPFGETLKKQVAGIVQTRAGDLQRFEKALGNEFVVGSTDAAAFVDVPSGEDDNFVGAIQAKDEGSLDELIKDEDAKEAGESNGATLYEDDSGDPFAVKDGVLVVAGSKKQLEDALATREDGDGLTEEDFDAGTEGISKDALLRVYVDIAALLKSSDDAKQALRSKWVQALTTAGIGLAFEDGKVAVDFRVNTDSESLTDEDLPFAAGSESPEVLDRDGAISVSLRDPSQLIEFAQATGKSVDPNGFGGGLATGKAELNRQLGIDIDEDLIGQLTGDLAVSVTLDGKFGARAELKDPAAFEDALAKVAKRLPEMLKGITGEKVGLATPTSDEDFYAVATADGTNVVFGVVEDVFVIANDPKIAGTLATDQLKAVPGAKGSLVLNASAEQLAQEIISQAAGQDFDLTELIGGKIVTRPLDELNGSVETSTSGLSGSFELTLDD